MAVKLKTRQEMLMTRVSDDGERIEIRLGFNWTEYGIKPYSLGALESTGLGVPRQVSLQGNIPVEVRIGGRTFHVLSPVPVTT